MKRSSDVKQAFFFWLYLHNQMKTGPCKNDDIFGDDHLACQLPF